MEGVRRELLQLDTPAQPVIEQPLAAPDNSTVSTHIKVIFLYKKLECEHLLQALQSTLVHYPVLLGRIRMDKKNGRWFAQNNNAGAPYEVAYHSARVGEAVGCDLENQEILLQVMGDLELDITTLFCSGEFDPLDAQAPVFACRETHFADGAVCLGVTLHHRLVDGFAAFAFMHAWASTAEAIQRGHPVPFVDVCHDRTLLSSKWPRPVYPHREYALQVPPVPPLATSSKPTSIQFPRTKMVVLDFSRTSLDQLHQAALSTMDVSINDALSALFWQAVTRARGLTGSRPTSLGYAVDGRPRLALPKISASYFGNVAFFGYLPVTAALLLQASLPEASRWVRQTTNSMTAEFLLDAIAWVNEKPNAAHITPPFKVFFGSDFAISNWCRSRLYGLTFGQGAAPLYAGLPPVPVLDGLMIITDSPHPGAVRCVLGLVAEHVDALQQDPFLRQFLSPIAK